MEHLLPRPTEMDFDASNLADAWKKWKQTMQLYLNAVMKQKTEEEKYSVFLFIIGEKGREIFNTWTWEKKLNENNQPTDEDDITIKLLMEKFEAYCLPRKNLVIERRKFFTRNQQSDESIDAYITELRNLSSTCEFQDIRDGLILYKLVDGIESNQVRDVLLRKGSNLNLEKAIEICRADEVTKKQLQLMLQEKEVAKIQKKKQKFYQKKHDKDVKDLEGATDGGKDGKNKKCKYCGRIHKPKMCPAYGQECRKCKKKNHWASCCQSRNVNETKQYVIETITEDDTRNVDACEATAVIKIEESNVRVKLDTGAEVNVMPKRVYDQLNKSNKKLTKTSVKLQGYGGHNIPVIGTIRMECSINDVHNVLLRGADEEQNYFRITELQRYDVSENHG